MVDRDLILLVEDSADDELLTRRALVDARVTNPVLTVRDGVQAIDFLRRRGSFASRVEGLPQLVLLDLKLPRLSGLDVLREVRADRLFEAMPIVVFTSSSEDTDARQAYALGANSYVRKPVEFDDFARAVRDVGLYWTVTNRVP